MERKKTKPMRTIVISTPSGNHARLQRAFGRLSGEYNFAGQYQQPPAQLGGALVKREWFDRYEQVPEKFDQVVRTGIRRQQALRG